MNNKSIFVLGAMIIVAALFLFKDNEPRQKNLDEDVESSDLQVPALQPRSEVELISAQPKSSDQTAVVHPSNPIAQLSEVALKRFAQHMVNMEKCLQLQTQNFTGGSVLPTADQLISGLRPNLGDSIVQLEDWSQFDVVDKSGLKKRIRIDVDYPDGATPNRRLSTYTVNSYGGLEIDNLTNDQSDNPNLSYIESLRDGMQTLSEEKAARVYFSQGEELLLTIKNGYIESFSLSKADKVYNCSNLTFENSVCTCP